MSWEKIHGTWVAQVLRSRVHLAIQQNMKDCVGPSYQTSVNMTETQM